MKNEVFSLGMPRRMLGQWAKEEIVETIDDMIREKSRAMDYDESNAMTNQRNRVAKFLDQPTKKLNEIMSSSRPNDWDSIL
jgi:hypothetical protein